MTSDASGHVPLRAAQFRGVGELILRSERDRGVHTIGVCGELDLASAAEVEAELLRVEATDATRIIVDLSGLTFIDSTGIRLMIAAQARSRADSDRLRLVRGQAGVQRVFEICGVEQLLPFAD